MIIKKLFFMTRLVFSLLLFQSCQDDGPAGPGQKIDQQMLASAFEAAGKIADIRSLVVTQNHVLVAEEYFNGGSPEPDTLLHVMSVTKSITSTLIGIAIDQGFIQSVNQTLSDFLGAEVDAVNPALGRVTLHQLMTMTCGHDWREIDDGSEFLTWISSPDQLNYILNKPIVRTPGTYFDYSDGAAHLISAVLTKATGKSASEFANEYLLAPLGLESRYWYADNRGMSYGGVGLSIGAYDMIEFGSLYLNNGNLNGQQIVSSDWITSATTAHISTNSIIPNLDNYGYFWWLGKAHGREFILALGYGGQFILVCRELNLVVAATCNFRGVSEHQANQNWSDIYDIIINRILPVAGK